MGRRRLAPAVRAALPGDQGVPLPRLRAGDLPSDPACGGVAGGGAPPAPPLAQGLLGAALRRAPAGGAAGPPGNVALAGKATGTEQARRRVREEPPSCSGRSAPQ